MSLDRDFWVFVSIGNPEINRLWIRYRRLVMEPALSLARRRWSLISCGVATIACSLSWSHHYCFLTSMVLFHGVAVVPRSLYIIHSWVRVCNSGFYLGI
ncbi:Phenylalanine--tRNA ligase [Psidium guajava]|nr:Phenylalanine--tRNA ligase [Psidium guajava]